VPNRKVIGSGLRVKVEVRVCTCWQRKSAR
jgi:hypothetical protein